MSSRVEALEGKGVVARWENYHTITARVGQSVASATDEYGRDKIGPNDFVVIRQLIAPRFDTDGDMIFFKDWPENQSASDCRDGGLS